MASFTLSHVLYFLLSVSFVSANPLSPLRHKRDPLSPAPYTASNCSACYYWLDEVKRQGIAPYAPDANYQVYRNVQDFGAVGDGITDDTAAINAAISTGDRCEFGSCQGSTVTPALVYFPPGTYLISSPIVDLYYTSLVGNPNCVPVLKGSSNFTGFAMIEGDPYGPDGNLAITSTNIFWRQIRNFIMDQTSIPVNSATAGIHWPTGQATSIQNVVFKMSQATGTQHQGLLIDNGSGGFVNDLVFYGGRYAAFLGNQQFTFRNLTIHNAVTAIQFRYNWGWTFTGISINNCGTGINITEGGAVQSVGSILMFDSEINNTPVGILSSFQDPNGKYTNGSIVLENIALNNVDVGIKNLLTSATILEGGTRTVTGFAQGHAYNPTGPQGIQRTITPNTRPAGLVDGNAFYQKSKPQYEDFPASQFLSVRTAGAAGDGSTDDTEALNAAIQHALETQKILYIDAGYYVVTKTIYIPAGSVIVGESYPVILGSGPYFSDEDKPQPVVQIGKPGEEGTIEWSDTIVSTRGATKGAILFELNLAAPGVNSASKVKRQDWSNWSAGTTSAIVPTGTSKGHGGSCRSKTKTTTSGGATGPTTTGKSGSTATGTSGPTGTGKPKPTSPCEPPTKKYKPTGPAGMWDVHARVGGFAGSELQLGDCPRQALILETPNQIKENCITAFLTMHITKHAANFYLENVWLWVADHDIETADQTQITVYAGRGLLVESTSPLWLWASAVEHHTLYEYQFLDASTVYMGQIQTETAYYQPNPPVLYPFDVRQDWNDPDYSLCTVSNGFNFTDSTEFKNYCDGYGLRIVDSHDLLIYGAGLYSFFDNYNTTCSATSNPNGGYGCQTQIFNLEGQNSNINIYTLNTVGAQEMIDIENVPVALYSDNLNVFPDNIAVFRLAGVI